MDEEEKSATNVQEHGFIVRDPLQRSDAALSILLFFDVVDKAAVAPFFTYLLHTNASIWEAAGELG